jgi:hypothetical protein
MKFQCGDFCGEAANNVRQLRASQRSDDQSAKLRRSNPVERKSMKIRRVLGNTKEPLLISGLEVRVLRGSPLILLRGKSLQGTSRETLEVLNSQCSENCSDRTPVLSHRPVDERIAA